MRKTNHLTLINVFFFLFANFCLLLPPKTNTSKKMKRIVTQDPLTVISKELRLDYSFVRRCLRFERDGLRAIAVRAKVLTKYKSKLVEL